MASQSWSPKIIVLALVVVGMISTAAFAQQYRTPIVPSVQSVISFPTYSPSAVQPVVQALPSLPRLAPSVYPRAQLSVIQKIGLTYDLALQIPLIAQQMAQLMDLQRAQAAEIAALRQEVKGGVPAQAAECRKPSCTKDGTEKRKDFYKDGKINVTEGEDASDYLFKDPETEAAAAEVLAETKALACKDAFVKARKNAAICWLNELGSTCDPTPPMVCKKTSEKLSPCKFVLGEPMGSGGNVPVKIYIECSCTVEVNCDP